MAGKQPSPPKDYSHNVRQDGKTDDGQAADTPAGAPEQTAAQNGGTVEADAEARVLSDGLSAQPDADEDASARLDGDTPDGNDTNNGKPPQA